MVPEESEDSGQKVALHEYPNSNRRFAEPLGIIPPVFSLTGIIHGPNYFEERGRLKEQLDTPGINVLVHPIYGLLNVQCLPYSISSSQTRVGEFVFLMEFAVSDASVEPTPLPANDQTVNNQANTTRTNLYNTLQNNYSPPENALETETSALTVTQMLNSIQTAITNVVNPIRQNLAQINTTITDTRTRLYRIIQTGLSLRNTFNNLFDSLTALSSEPENLTAMWNSLVNFNRGPGTNVSSLGATDTVSRLRRETNKSVIDESVRLAALFGLHQSIANTDFETENDLLAAMGNVNRLFTDYFENNVIPVDGITSLADDQDLRSSAFQLRVLTKTTLDNQISNVWRIVNIDQGLSSMSLTAYRYYGDLDNIDNLIGLNPNVNVANFIQPINAITR